MNDLATIAASLDQVELWGLEMDPAYRVVAATLDGVKTTPDGQPRRLQLLMHPVGLILATLQTKGSVLRFDGEQLISVSQAFGGATPASPIFGRPEPRPGAWSPTWSLEGRSHAPDGRQHTATFQVTHGDDELAVFVRFDVAELRDEGGNMVMTTSDDPRII